MLILVALLGACYAQEEEEFTYRVPSPKGVFFYETFQDDLEALNWSPSSDEKFKEGEWKIGAGDHIQALATETGLIVTEAARHHAISTKFPVAFDPASADEIVIQYEVRFEKSHECGGAYIKVLQDSDTFKPESFNDQDGYIVMFGPDKCSSTDKVHLIIKHQNPVSKEFEEKHLKTPPRIKNDRNTHLYTAVLRKDNTYEVFIDSVSAAKGSLLTDFEPAFQPPK
jgi:calnexin